MSSSDRFLLSYLRAFLRLACGWLHSIWFSVWITILRPTLSNWGIRQESHIPSVLKYSLTTLKSETSTEKSVWCYEDMPMAKGWPLIGTTFDLISAGSAPYLHKYIDKRHQQFGHIFRERLGSQEAVFVSSANLMRSVFLYEGQFPTHPLPDSWILYNKLHNCQRGLFFMDGPEWHTNRKIMNRFLINGNLDWMYVHINDCTDKLIESWNSNVQNVDGFWIIDNLEEQLYRWSIDVVSAIMFGYATDNVSEKLTAALNTFSKNVHKIFESSAQLMSFPPKIARFLNLKIWTQFEKSVTEVLQQGYEIIDMHMKQVESEGEDDGLFSKMYTAGIPMDVIKRIFVDLIIAAGDTTAFSSQWALYLLSKNTEIQDKIRVEQMTAEKARTVDGLIKETLRLYPVAPFIGRFIASDAIIGNYEIKKNTMIILSLYTSGRDADHFPDPLNVKPERWFRDAASGKLNGVLQAHGSLPFAIGNRSCIGRKIALKQMHSLIAAIANNFHIKCFNKEPIDVVLRLVAVPNNSIRLGIQLVDQE